MKLEVSDVKRLSFARYLIKKAQEQMMLSSPINASAVLSAQDAVELFQIVTLQKFDIDPNKHRFMEFWELLNAKGLVLPYKEPMRDLNNCRVGIKHQGLFPSSFDVEKKVSDTLSFLEESTRLVFDINFMHLSLVDYVAYEDVRALLHEGASKLDESDCVASIEDSAKAFFLLERRYESERCMQPGDKPYSFNSIGSFNSGFDLFGSEGKFRKLGKYVDGVNKSISSIDRALKAVVLGIDFDSLRLIPKLSRTLRADSAFPHLAERPGPLKMAPRPSFPQLKERWRCVSMGPGAMLRPPSGSASQTQPNGRRRLSDCSRGATPAGHRPSPPAPAR